MITISRSEALDEILLGIYRNKNVNFENHKVVINDDRIRKTLYSLTSATNLRYLLEVTFKKSDVKFEDKKKGKNFALNKETVIDNTVEYFRGLGIYIPEVVNPTERTLLGILMCDAILEHILPAIFSNTNTEKGKFNVEIADISLEFNKAINCIKSKFCSDDFFEQLYVDIRSSDVEKLYDSEYSEDECNFGVLVYTNHERIFKRLDIIPTIYYYSYNDKEQQPLASNVDNDQFTELTSKFIRSSALDNQNFVSPYYYKPNQDEDAGKAGNAANEYKLSFNIETPNSHFIPRYFYFMTKIDERIIEEKYSTCDSAAKLNQVLSEKAIKQIRIKYTEKLTEYYQQKIANIETICRKFLEIDVESILSQNIQSIMDLKNAMKALCNEKELDEVWDLCKENGLSAQQASRYIYCGIETAIQDFLFVLLESLRKEADFEKETKPYLLLSIENEVPKLAILKHINVLTTLLKNASIDELSELRTEHNNFVWKPNAGSRMNYRNDSDLFPIHDRSKDVYSCLKDHITYYCNILNDVEL